MKSGWSRREFLKTTTAAVVLGAAEKTLAAASSSLPKRRLGKTSMTNAWQGLDPTERRRRTLEAIKRILLKESQLQPLLIVFEGLHWIDSEIQAFVDNLIESVPNARFLC